MGKPTIKPVEVVLPQVKIRLQDLSYLRSLAEPVEGIKCVIPQSTESRLKILGLIEDYNAGPCPAAVKSFEKERLQRAGELRRIVSRDQIDWDKLGQMHFYSLREANRPKDRISTRITKAGLKLLKDGASKVQIGRSCK